MTIMEARGLMPDSKSRKIHPYVQVEIENSGTLRTDAISSLDAVLREQRGEGSMSEPEWRTQIEFRMDNVNHRLTFSVMNKHALLAKDGLLGKCTHTLFSLGGLANATVEKWLPLEAPEWMTDGQRTLFHGELKIALTLNVPPLLAPLYRRSMLKQAFAFQHLPDARAIETPKTENKLRPLGKEVNWSSLLNHRALMDARREDMIGILSVHIGRATDQNSFLFLFLFFLFLFSRPRVDFISQLTNLLLLQCELKACPVLEHSAVTLTFMLNSTLLPHHTARKFGGIPCRQSGPLNHFSLKCAVFRTLLI